jgi:hypothetical protein
LADPGLVQALRNLPFVDSVFKLAGDSGIRDAEGKGLATRLNETAEDQGIRMTITEVLYDGVRLVLGYVIESDRKLLPIRPEITVNGIKQKNNTAGNRNEIVDEGRIAGVIDIFPEKALPEKFDLKLRFSSLADRTHLAEGILEHIEGSWIYSFPVVQTKSQTKTWTFNDATARMGESALSVTQVVLSPSVTKIDFETTGPEGPLVNVSEPNKREGFQVLDDRGIPLEVFGGGGSSGPQSAGENITRVSRHIELAPLGEIPAYLIIRPYSATSDYANAGIEKAEWSADKSPILLSQGDVGTVTVINVDFTQERTLLTYRVEGEDPFEQAKAIWVEDESGQTYTSSPTLISREAMLFSMELPSMKETQKIVVAAVELPRLEVTKGLEVKIPLQ